MQEGDIIDALRNPFFLVYVSCLLSFCMVSGAHQLSEVVELEFVAHRMHQFELNGNFHGAKNSKVQYEAVSLDSKALRKCVVTLWRDVATRNIDDLLSTSVGALLIIIPADLSVLNPADKELFLNMERTLWMARSELAIYVTNYSPESAAILNDVTSSTKSAGSATQQLLNSVAANTFQFTSSGTPSTSPLSYQPHNVIGKLLSSDRNAPTLAFVAHYDSHSVFPGATVGSDSNGSGVVMLLELLAVLSKFYENPATKPPYNIVFVWTAAGKFNYQGTRSFIEALQNDKNADFEKIELAICIEAVGGSGPLYVHSSKQPANGSAASQLLKRLRIAASSQKIELVTKKINLNAPELSWEHERFNIKRMSSVTISRYSSPDNVYRRSMLDSSSSITLENLERNIRYVAEAVLGYVLSLPEDGFSTESRISADASVLSKDAIDKQRLAHFVRQFASRPRPLSDEAATKATSANLATTVATYSKVSIAPVQLQDAQVWGGSTDRLVAEQVKPAVFELFVAGGVFVYLAIFYQVVTIAQPTIEGVVSSIRKQI